MKSRIEKYKKLERVGEGTYGVVYKAQGSFIYRLHHILYKHLLDTSTSHIYALKKIRL